MYVDAKTLGTEQADAAGNWSFTIAAGLRNGTQAITAIAADAAQNASSVSDETVVTVDTVPPHVTVGLSDRALEAGETSLVTFTFTEAPVGFSVNDLTAEGGTLSGLSATTDPMVYTAISTPTADLEDATNVIMVGTGWSDAAGSGPDGTAASVNYTIDTRVNKAPSAVTLLDPVSPTLEGGAPEKVADIAVTDDELGTETLSLVGADAGSFEIRGTELWFRSGLRGEHRRPLSAAPRAPDRNPPAEGSSDHRTGDSGQAGNAHRHDTGRGVSRVVRASRFGRGQDPQGGQEHDQHGSYGSDDSAGGREQASPHPAFPRNFTPGSPPLVNSTPGRRRSP